MTNRFMTEAMKEAQIALEIGEIPIGAVIVKDNEIIARGHNLRQTMRDATLHAEVVAIQAACKVLGDWRLDDCDIYVTLEPCTMCAGAIINARMRRVFFGAYDPEYGGSGGKIDLFAPCYFGSKTEVYGGIMEKECTDFLNDFFKSIRQKNKTE
ncbi:MAG: nucleoside deaminase [Clostridia bacterium]|nr:nucleoside deaminase [Clostridia bacterium]